MKKTYFIPAMKVVVIQTTQMLAASPNAIIDPNSSIDPSSVEAPALPGLLDIPDLPPLVDL